MNRANAKVQPRLRAEPGGRLYAKGIAEQQHPVTWGARRFSIRLIHSLPSGQVLSIRASKNVT